MNKKDMRECNFMSRSVVVTEKDGTVICCPRDIVIKNKACCVGYFLTALRRNPGQSFSQDYNSLPEYVLVNGIEFKKSDRLVLFEKPRRHVYGEYYRIDYEGRIKNIDGEWEDNSIIRPDYPVVLTRGIHFHGTRVLTMKY